MEGITNSENTTTTTNVGYVSLGEQSNEIKGYQTQQMNNAYATREYLTKQNWPEGLQELFIATTIKIPIRFFILDNSGSMIINDSNKITVSNKQKIFAKCSRWEELVQMVSFHAGIANAAGLPSEFRLLNNAEPFLIGQQDEDDLTYRNFLNFLKRNRPNESTPLCTQIGQVISKIKEMELSLLQQNQRVAVIICSDGESSDGDIVTAMRPLEHLPCNIVVRLCTEEARIVDYWNEVRKAFPVDVISILKDVRNSAMEVKKINSWLTYGEPIHRFREFGISVPDFNALSEHLLTPRQLRLFTAHILGGDATAFPNPTENLSGFQNAIKMRLEEIREESYVWDPIKQQPVRWFNVDEIGEVYKDKKKCTLM